MSLATALNLERDPFTTSPDPSFFYKSSEHYTVLNRLEIAIRLRRGLCLVLGDVGTGKTTLSRTLFRSFADEEDEYIFHLILDPAFKSEYQFLAHLTKVFGISPFFRSTTDHREAIEQYLYQRAVEEKKTVVLIIDEGQKLSLPQLEVLRTLLNYETNEFKMIQLVIMGQMELLPRLKKIPNFMDRISMKYIINPLDEFETGKMIEFRLRQAGYALDRHLFTHEAIRKIHEFTQGYPRKISRICHSALEHLIMHNKEVISQDVIEDILREEDMWV